jgi:tryptophanyl-tRNA synthetase
MSGSDTSPKSRILLDEAPDSIIKKVKSAVTDTGSEVAYDPVDKPGISNLIELMSFFTGRSIEAVADEYRHSGYGAFKSAAGEAIAAALEPIRVRYQATDASEVERIMADGAATARDRADREMASVRERVGLS